MRGTAFRAGWGEIEIEVEYVNLHQHLNLGLDWAWVQLGLWTGLDRNWIEQGRAEQRRDETSGAERVGGLVGRTWLSHLISCYPVPSSPVPRLGAFVREAGEVSEVGWGGT